MLDKTSEALLRQLIYPVQFDNDPAASADRVVKRLPAGCSEDFRKAVDAGLSSADKLSALIPQRHPEETIRAYLLDVRRRL